MAEGLVQTNSQELVRPGPFGRAIRACLGFATLSLLLPLLTVWREEPGSGQIACNFGLLDILLLIGAREMQPVFPMPNRFPLRNLMRLY